MPSLRVGSLAGAGARMSGGSAEALDGQSIGQSGETSTGQDAAGVGGLDDDQYASVQQRPMPTTPLGRLQRRMWILLDDPASSTPVGTLAAARHLSRALVTLCLTLSSSPIDAMHARALRRRNCCQAS